MESLISYTCNIALQDGEKRRPPPEIDARELIEEIVDVIDGKRGDGRRRPPMGSDNEGPSDDVRGRPRKGGPRNGGSEERPESTEPAKRQNGGQRPGPPRDSEVSQTYCLLHLKEIILEQNNCNFLNIYQRKTFS